uniref:Uncharacterized protein LOC114346663 n=1 Tax=Diabrotica virgifera virgifera TaxID=50390 RepID=A0A6P7GTU4_DIAVI
MEIATIVEGSLKNSIAVSTSSLSKVSKAESLKRKGNQKESPYNMKKRKLAAETKRTEVIKIHAESIEKYTAELKRANDMQERKILAMEKTNELLEKLIANKK